MLPTRLFRFVTPLYILCAVLPVCGQQLYEQHRYPRMTFGPAARTAAVRELARRAAGGPIASATVALAKAAGTFITFDAPGAACGG